MRLRTPSAALAAASRLLLFGVGRSGAEKSYGYYDTLRLDPATLLGRAGNVNLHQDTDTDRVVGLCNLHGLLWIEEDVYSIDSVAAALLAMHHFNTGDGSVVDELVGIDERCAVRFTAEFEDTWGSEYTALGLLADVVGGDQDCGDASGGGNESSRGFVSPSNLRQSSSTVASSTSLPCAILGATRSASSEPTSMLSASYGLPQMSWESGSEELSNKDVYPLFSRVIPAVAATAKASYQHLANLGVKHCAVLYLNDAYGISFLKSFQGFASSGGTMDTISVAYSPNTAAMVDADQVAEAVKNLKATGYRYIYVITYPEHIDLFLEEASRQGIVGDDYHWFIGTDALYQETVEAGSLLDRAYHGVGFLQLTTGKEGLSGYDRFLKEWRSLDASAKSHFASLTPNMAEGYNYTSSVPIGWAFLAYDAVVSLGLAACDAAKDESSFFTGSDLHDALQQVVFEGASGLIRFDAATGTREPTSALFEILNLRRKGIAANDGKAEFEVVLSTALTPNEDGTDWEVMQVSPFIFADGSTSPPPDLPPVNGGKGVDYHYVGNLAILGYVLLAIIGIVSLSFAGWTFVQRNTRVVRASQPPFLLMICAGVLIMAPAIFTLSVDDEHFSTTGASMACMATPWLLSLGFTISFAALFSKTWRINKILTNPKRFQRVKVDAKDVLGPFGVFFTMNAILLICWTAVDPLEYVRKVDTDGTDQFNRPISSYGKCTFDGNAQIFIGCLVAVNSVIVVFTTVQAYRARKISVDYSESKYIAGCIVCQLEALIIGIPTIVMMSSDEDSHRSIFVLASLIIFIASMAILLLIFVPKILVHSDKRPVRGSARGGLRFMINKEAEFRNGVVVVEGAGTSTASSGQRNSLEIRAASESRRQESIEEVKIDED